MSTVIRTDTMVINDYIQEGWETLAGKKAIFQHGDKNGTSEPNSNSNP